MNVSSKPPTPPPPRTKSGEHPSVKAYRAKLESIAEHEGRRLDEALEGLDKLDADLKAYLDSTPPPPEEP